MSRVRGPRVSRRRSNFERFELDAFAQEFSSRAAVCCIAIKSEISGTAMCQRPIRFLIDTGEILVGQLAGNVEFAGVLEQLMRLLRIAGGSQPFDRRDGRQHPRAGRRVQPCAHGSAAAQSSRGRPAPRSTAVRRSQSAPARRLRGRGPGRGRGLSRSPRAPRAARSPRWACSSAPTQVERVAGRPTTASRQAPSPTNPRSPHNTCH